MAKQLQLRRGTTAQHSTFTGAIGEVTVDTDKGVVVVHNGSNIAGSGKAMIKETDTAYTIATVNDFSTVPSGITTVIVKDKDRGGVFNRITSTTANGGTIFSGTGYSWERQYNSLVNVKWFGAKGDGVTDDTLSIQNALDNSSSVFIPKSTYKTVSELVLNQSILVYGEGAESVILAPDFVNVSALKINSNDITLKDFKITTGIFPTAFKSNNNAIYSAVNKDVEYSNINIENISIYGFCSGGISLNRPKDSFVKNCIIESVGRFGVFFYGGLNSHIIGCTIKDIIIGSGGNAPFINAYGISFTCDTSIVDFPRPTNCSAIGNYIENIPNWEGLDTHGGRGILFEGNTVVDTMIGVFVGPSSGVNNVTADDVKVINNTFTTTTTKQRPAIIVAPTYNVGNTYGYNFVVSNNIIKGYGVNQAVYDLGYTSIEGAIHVIGARNVVVNSNQIHKFNNIGIYVRQHTQGCEISSNVIIDGVETNSLVYGMAFENPTTTMCSVDNNLIQRLSGVLNGIYVIGDIGGTVYGVRYNKNSLINLTLDFEASARGRLHRNSSELVETKIRGYVTNNGTTATLVNGVGISSVERNSTGNVRINFADTTPSTTYMVNISPRGGQAVYSTFSNNTNSYVDVFTWDKNGALIDYTFSLEIKY